MTIIAIILKNTLDLHSKTDINNDKFWKMGTIVEFRLLVLDSLKYSSKAESPINRFAKAVISRNLTTSRHNHLLFIYLFIFFYSFICLFIIYLFICFFIIYLFIFSIFFNFLFYFSYTYRKQALPSYLCSDSNHCCWLARMNKKYIL